MIEILLQVTIINSKIIELNFFIIIQIYFCCFYLFYFFLGLENVKVEKKESAGTWYCSVFNLNVDPHFEEEGRKRERTREGKKGEIWGNGYLIQFQKKNKNKNKKKQKKI